MAIEIVDFPIKNGDFPQRTVKLPEGSRGYVGISYAGRYVGIGYAYVICTSICQEVFYSLAG